MLFLIEPALVIDTLPIGAVNGVRASTLIKAIAQHLIPSPAVAQRSVCPQRIRRDIWLFTNELWLTRLPTANTSPHENAPSAPSNQQFFLFKKTDFTPIPVGRLQVVGACSMPRCCLARVRIQQAVARRRPPVPLGQSYYLDVPPRPLRQWHLRARRWPSPRISTDYVATSATCETIWHGSNERASRARWASDRRLRGRRPPCHKLERGRGVRRGGVEIILRKTRKVSQTARLLPRVARDERRAT